MEKSRIEANLMDRLALRGPLIQAPMAGGATTPELVAAVSNAGALGSLGGGYLAPAELENAIRQTRSFTNRPFAVNLFIPAPEPIVKQDQITLQFSRPGFIGGNSPFAILLYNLPSRKTSRSSSR